MDSYVYIITALLPLAAFMLIFQTNPYHALIIRGILGAIAALTYTVLGAADVALTEALVGTLLAIMLYAVAVRSSLVFRLGVLQGQNREADEPPQPKPVHDFSPLLAELQTLFGKRHLQVELTPYQNLEEMQRALIEKEIHATCTSLADPDPGSEPEQPQRYQTTTRLRRLYEIMTAELAASTTHLTCLDPTDSKQEQP